MIRYLFPIFLACTSGCIAQFPLLAQESSNTIEITVSVSDEWDQERFDDLFEQAEELWDEGALEKAAALYTMVAKAPTVFMIFSWQYI